MRKCLEDTHRTNRFLAALEPEVWTALEPHLDVVELARGQVLYEAGDLVQHAYFPHDAIIGLVNGMQDGTASEVAVFGRESFMGVLSAIVTRESFGCYVVQGAGSASRILVDRLDEVRNTYPVLHHLIVCYAEVLLIQIFQSVSCNALHSVEARCCRWILSMHDRSGQALLPLTHEFLAEMLGVQRSTVSIVTRMLHTRGLITQSRGGIEVVDRGGLETIACECYNKIRKVYRRLLPGTYQ